MVEVPGPEPDWERAPEYQGGKRNPAFQASVWDYAASGFRLVAGLSASMDALAARLRLHIEKSWEDPGPVEVATFCIRKVDFALSLNVGSGRPDVYVWVGRDQTDVDAALDILLEALGIGRDALTFQGDLETGFVDLRADRES